MNLQQTTNSRTNLKATPQTIRTTSAFLKKNHRNLQQQKHQAQEDWKKHGEQQGADASCFFFVRFASSTSRTLKQYHRQLEPQKHSLKQYYTNLQQQKHQATN